MERLRSWTLRFGGPRGYADQFVRSVLAVSDSEGSKAGDSFLRNGSWEMDYLIYSGTRSLMRVFTVCKQAEFCNCSSLK